MYDSQILICNSQIQWIAKTKLNESQLNVQIAKPGGYPRANELGQTQPKHNHTHLSRIGKTAVMTTVNNQWQNLSTLLKPRDHEL